MRKIIMDFEEYEDDFSVDPSREELLLNDEISPEEEAFMRGFEEAG